MDLLTTLGSIINTVLELIVTLLPLPFIIGLNMSLRQKFSVFGILNLGIFISIVGCVRCWFVWKALVSTWDVSWWGVPHWVVSEVENNLALVSLHSIHPNVQQLTIVIDLRLYTSPASSPGSTLYEETNLPFPA